MNTMEHPTHSERMLAPLTEQPFDERLTMYKKFFDAYCTPTDTTTMLSCFELGNTVVSLKQLDDADKNSSSTYSVQQFDLDLHTETEWRVWQANDYNYNRVSNHVERSLIIYTDTSLATIHMTHRGITWESEGETHMPRLAQTPDQLLRAHNKRATEAALANRAFLTANEAV